MNKEIESLETKIADLLMERDELDSEISFLQNELDDLKLKDERESTQKHEKEKN